MQAVTEPSGVSPETFKAEVTSTGGLEEHLRRSFHGGGALLSGNPSPAWSLPSGVTISQTEELWLSGIYSGRDHGIGSPDCCSSYVCLLAAEPDFTSTDVLPSFRRLSTATTAMSRLAPYGEDVLVQELNSYMLVTKAGALNV
ncbi:hypothetical protein DY000_02025353 [Brassica cretica]|uniref:Uncharacterized protein n=1 Tax=Brassica cretica TaxID=69181 RepID=A0ABQ7E866_BRACR|nr:hypothetical protein DY000_02025353 [Brassica cretica]